MSFDAVTGSRRCLANAGPLLEDVSRRPGAGWLPQAGAETAGRP